MTGAPIRDTLPVLPAAFRDAPCRQLPQLWDGEKPAHIEEAIGICREQCPLLDACYEHHRGVRGLAGVIAGRAWDTNTRERYGIRGYGLDREHGTPRGYEQHKYRGEYACQPCRDAHAAHERRLRAARKAAS